MYCINNGQSGGLSALLRNPNQLTIAARIREEEDDER